ncbi:MAG TPA: mycothiol system anti-sigma-R factor [Gemmatimonadales bacterium]|nr:mycothiol system anti-sigma-R factor [Gemmatimonadales bacterium]
MNCREAADHLYEYLDRELTPDVQAQIKEHLAHCPPCGQHFDFEQSFLKFLEARCRAKGASPDLRRRILRELFGE